MREFSVVAFVVLALELALAWRFRRRAAAGYRLVVRYWKRLLVAAGIGYVVGNLATAIVLVWLIDNGYEFAESEDAVILYGAGSVLFVMSLSVVLAFALRPRPR